MRRHAGRALSHRGPASGPRTLLLVAVLLGCGGAVSAQDPDEAREALRLPLPTTTDGPNTYWSIPAMGANSPSGFGAGWGDIYFGMGGTTRARFQADVFGDADAAAAVGFGLGNPETNIGIEVTVNSYSTFNSGFFTRSGVDFHVHRMLPGEFGIAVGSENTVRRGPPDSGTSQYVALSKWFSLTDDPDAPLSALMVTGGIGNGRFRSQQDVDNDVGGVNPFGSIGLRVFAPFSIVADWTGQDLTLVGSLAPFRNVSLIIVGGLADVTGNVGDEFGPRVVGSVSYGVNLAR